MKTLIYSFVIFLPLLSFARSWDSHSNPLLLNKDFSIKFDETLTEGKLSDGRKGWPGNHWSNWLGGAAYRWSAANPQNFKYKLNKLEDLQNLEPHELAELSPTEKFDIFKGDYNYSTTRTELSRVSPNESKWHGICHGYAPASANHSEPQTLILTNADGVEIKFYSSDVAALLSLYYAEFAKTPVQFVGRRCKSSRGVRVWNKGSCETLNPGSLHVALNNTLGNGQPLILDIEGGFEVWNFVATSFKTYFLASDAPISTSAPGTARRILVETTVAFAADTPPKFNPVLFTDDAYYVHRLYEYYLDLDANDNIVGGEWISKNGPDFMWLQDKAEFKGSWSALNEVYQPISLPATESDEEI